MVPLLLALVSSAYFIDELPVTARDEGEGWISPLGLKPLGDDAGEYVQIADALSRDRAFEFGGEPN